MKKRLLVICTLLLSLVSCTGDSNSSNTTAAAENKVLMLKVDYLTNTFEGGKEFIFDEPATTFTVHTEYQSPGDFGGIQLYYEEIDEKLFDGTIVWMGLGEISFPESFTPADQFAITVTNDYVAPAGYENVFNPSEADYDYTPVWNAIQSRVKVREYIRSNPNATVKIFLYTPSVGVGNPADWDWIILIKD